MVNDEWSGAEALENAFRVADEELRKVERERDQAREQQAIAERQRNDAHIAYEKVSGERDAAVARAEAHAKGATRANLDRDKAYEELTAMTNRAEAAEARTAPAVSRADVAEALSRCLNPEMWNVTFPSVVNEVCDLFGIEDRPDPVEAKAKELWDVARPSDDAMWRDLTSEAQQEYQRIAAHILGQEAKR